jgi:hypothetical protein
VVREVRFKVDQVYPDLAAGYPECHRAADEMISLLSAEGWEPMGTGYHGLPRFQRRE